jgi:hypothetical protein
MKDLRSQLRQGDPLARESGPSPADIERMRGFLASASPPAASGQHGLFLALAAVLLFASVGSALLVRAPLPQRPDEQPAAAPGGLAGAGSGLRQLQFSTPGGTRVIWTFNPNLEVR